MTIIRFIQGVGVGGEWGGSVLLAMEWARTNRHRGFIASWPQLGGPAGLLLANLAVLVFSAISGDQFLVWGWRIPFLFSIVMVGIGLYIRLGILETPIFRRLVAEDRIERTPALEVIKRQPRQIILAALARMGEQAPAYIYLAFVFAYGTQVLHTPRDFLLTALVTAGLVSFITIPLSGHLSDRFGRKRNISDRLGRHRGVRLHLLRNAEHHGSGLDLLGDRAVLYSARRYVRPAGGPDRGMLYAAAPL